MKRELELYIHIPFCVRKCAYCDFLSAPASRETMQRYVDALCREICEFPLEKQYEVSTVFLGGGTPSVLPLDMLEKIFQSVYRKFDFSGRGTSRAWGGRPEITIECNPGTADKEKLAAWRSLGISRLSLGLQSADNGELQKLGRIHTWEDFLATYRGARSEGFDNINIDLMSALPGQTADSWKRTLEKVLALEPEHISAYSLILEEGTPFYDRYHEEAQRRDAGLPVKELPSEEEERRMYELTEQYLGAAGLYRYEISNYARPGYECRHNIGYWKRTEYAGLGLGAASLLENCRYKNTEDLGAYLASDLSGRHCERLSVREQMEEFMFLGLRMTRGVSEETFVRTFGRTAEEVYGPVLKKLTEQGLLCREDGRIFLSPRGLDLANLAMSEFLFI